MAITDIYSERYVPLGLPAEPGHTRLGVLTDIHLAPANIAPARWHNDYDFSGAQERLARSLDLLNSQGVAGLAVLGDLTHVGDRASTLQAVDQIRSAWPGPLGTVAGNHDSEELSDALASAEQPDIAAVSATPEPGETAAMVVLSHYPLLSLEEPARQAGLRYAGDRARELDVRAETRRVPTIVLCGHLHIRGSTSSVRTLQLSFASLIEPPYEVAIVDISGDPEAVSVSVHHIQASDTPAGVRLPLLGSDKERWTYACGQWTRR